MHGAETPRVRAKIENDIYLLRVFVFFERTLGIEPTPTPWGAPRMTVQTSGQVNGEHATSTTRTHTSDSSETKTPSGNVPSNGAKPSSWVSHTASNAGSLRPLQQHAKETVVAFHLDATSSDAIILTISSTRRQGCIEASVLGDRGRPKVMTKWSDTQRVGEAPEGWLGIIDRRSPPLGSSSRPPHLTAPSYSPCVPTTIDKSKPQQQKERDGVLSSLKMTIDGPNLAKEASSATLAKAAFDSIVKPLVMIRVNFILFCNRVS